MARAIERLSARFVATVKKPGYHADGGNLWLQVSPTGTKSWVFRFTLAGRAREMGVGGANDFSLAEARARAKAARKLLADGIDPIAHRDGERAQHRSKAANVRTFAWCGAAYIEAHEAGWRSAKHAAQWRATLATYAAPIIGDMDVSAIETEHVLACLEPIWRTKTETASRLRGRIESVLDWATVRKYRQGENPARWRGHLDHILPKPTKVAAVQHHPALPWAEMPAFMQKLRTMPGTAARALEFVILTATRTSETFNATWQEIDLERRLWTIPASRMKANREHTIPLSGRAMAILQAMAQEHGSSGFVFKSRGARPLSNMAGLMLLKRMGRPDLTTHGFRSTFRDWAGESTAHARESVEHALAHRIPDKVEAAYQRGTLLEKRRALMADWAEYCAREPHIGAVVPLRAAG